MYAVMEMRTNEQGIMTIVDPIFKTPNPTYAESRVYELCAAAVGSSVYVHTVLCVNEHGQSQFGTPKYFEHIPQPKPEPSES